VDVVEPRVFLVVSVALVSYVVAVIIEVSFAFLSLEVERFKRGFLVVFVRGVSSLDLLHTTHCSVFRDRSEKGRVKKFKRSS
jgi:hypothetical protein